MTRSTEEEAEEAAGSRDASEEATSAESNETSTVGCIVLGLGNPGERYTATRHNVGFRVVEELARRRGTTFDHHECNARVALTAVAADASAASAMLLVAPQTFMNRSGHAARCLQERRALAPERFLVVYDEIHLPLGALRLRRRGSPAGHRGMESVLESLGTDRVPRLRLGVGTDDGPAGEDLVSFVLEPFAEDEKERVEAMVRRAADACETWATDGSEVAMQRFNGPPPPLD